jgi:uncharacterized protein with FMN-binding domain
MSSSTKIWVIPKGMILGVGVAIAALVILLAIILLSGSKDETPSYKPTSSGVVASENISANTSSDSQNGTAVVSTDTSHSSQNGAAVVSTDTSHSSQNGAAVVSTDTSHSSQSVSADVSADTALYTPGVYTSSIWLDNSPVSVKVTVDENNINGIDLSYTDEAITTMYPMLGSCFNELAAEVCNKNSTKNITYSTENRYTAAVILKGIEASLDKALK